MRQPLAELTTLSRVFQLVYSFSNTEASIYSELIQLWESGITALSNVQGLDVQLLIQPQPVTNGTNSLGLPAGKQDIVLGALTAAYDLSNDTALVRETIRMIYDQQLALLKQQGVYLDFQYLNYADPSQDPIGSYGAANVAALQATSEKYDPDGFFQTGVPGGFKLF